MSDALTCGIEGENLVVRVPISTLVHAFKFSNYNVEFNEESGEFNFRYRVINKADFAKDVANEMLHEEEDGSTPLSNFFDKACELAVGNGSISIEGDGSPFDGK